MSVTLAAIEPLPKPKPAPRPSEIAWLRYVIHGRVDAYEALGWRVVDTLAGTSHGAHAVLMRWSREGEPVEPEKVA